MTEELVATVLARHPAVEVHRHGARDSMRDVVAETAARLLIVAAGERALLTDCRGVLDGRPLVKVVAVSGAADEGWMYELVPVRRPLGNLSAATLLGAVDELHGEGFSWDDG